MREEIVIGPHSTEKGSTVDRVHMKNSILVLFAVALVGTLSGCSSRTQMSERRVAEPRQRANSDQEMTVTQRVNHNTPAKAASPPPSVSAPSNVVASAPSPLPPFIVELLRNPSRPQNYSLMTNVDPAQVEVLANAYLSTPELTNRLGLMSALSFVGDDRGYWLFLNTLTNEMKGRTLTEKEASVMTSLAACLGVLARRSDAAYRFIVEQGSWPSFWAQHRPWKRDENDELVNDELAGWCIQFLGYSERPDLDAVLEELKKRHEQGFPRRFSGAIVDAAFHQSVVRRYGFIEAGNSVLRNLEVSLPEFMKWIESPEGKRWDEWSDQVNKIEMQRKEPNR